MVLAAGLPIPGTPRSSPTSGLAIPGALVLVFGMYAWAIEPPTAEDHA